MLTSVRSPDLCRGITLAFFNSSGKTPVRRLKLKIWAKGTNKNEAACFITLDDISSVPEDVDLIELIYFSISVEFVGVRKKNEKLGALGRYFLKLSLRPSIDSLLPRFKK